MSDSQLLLTELGILGGLLIAVAFWFAISTGANGSHGSGSTFQ